MIIKEFAANFYFILFLQINKINKLSVNEVNFNNAFDFQINFIVCFVSAHVFFSFMVQFKVRILISFSLFAFFKLVVLNNNS